MADDYVGPVFCSCGASSKPVSNAELERGIPGWKREPKPRPGAPAFVEWTCPDCNGESDGE